MPAPIDGRNTVHPGKFVYKLLGNASGGSKEMAVDGTTPVTFEWVSDGEVYLSRLTLGADDATAVDVTGFFSIAALTNGMLFRVVNAADVSQLDFTDGNPIKTTTDWNLMAAGDATADSDSVGGKSHHSVRFTFEKAGGLLYLPLGWKIQLVVQDDFSVFVAMNAMVHGIYRGD